MNKLVLNYKVMCCGPAARRQTLQILIRLFLKEQSDPVLHCLLLKKQPDRFYSVLLQTGCFYPLLQFLLLPIKCRAHSRALSHCEISEKIIKKALSCMSSMFIVIKQSYTWKLHANFKSPVTLPNICLTFACHRQDQK